MTIQSNTVLITGASRGLGANFSNVLAHDGFKIIGVGPKNFLLECQKDKYKKIESDNFNYRCNTHPHNIYLELLSETGIIGIISFLVIVIIIFNKIDGVQVGTDVLISGVKVGFVNKVSLEKNYPLVSVLIDKNIVLPNDSSISIQTDGLFGAKFNLKKNLCAFVKPLLKLSPTWYLPETS